MAECIEEGFLPLNEDLHAVSWDRYNLYRNIDAANLVIPEITDDMKPVTESEIANFSPE